LNPADGDQNAFSISHLFSVMWSETKKSVLVLVLVLQISDVVLWNTVLPRSSSKRSWRTQQLFKYRYCL